MSDNKTKPTDASIESFLAGVADTRRAEAHTLIAMMREIAGEEPRMWGPSIIGFGAMHYAYDTGREGDMPRLAFSPRKASITIYFSEGFDRYGHELAQLGKHRQSVSCLYINKLADIDLDVLHTMLAQSFALVAIPQTKPTTVDEYLANVPAAARPKFDELRQIVRDTLPGSKEVLSYGIVGYKIDEKRARVFISGWKDHLAIYPIPKSSDLQKQLAPYIKGKGTLWFPLDAPLPTALITHVVKECSV